MPKESDKIYQFSQDSIIVNQQPANLYMSSGNMAEVAQLLALYDTALDDDNEPLSLIDNRGVIVL